MPDRPPVCVIACAWYPPIQLRALAYPDTTVNAFLCGLQLPDVLYRVLTGNRPTRIYIGNECRLLDGCGEHRSSKAHPRHVTVSLRLVTQKGKCTLLCPDQPLTLRSDALAELVCCETITSTTTREIRVSMADRALSDDEEQAFLELQRANHQWVWSRTLEPPRALPQPHREDLPPLPPWKQHTFEWVESLKRLRDSKMNESIGHVSSNEGCAAASDRNAVREQTRAATCQRTVGINTLEGSKERQVKHVHDSKEPNDIDEPQIAPHAIVANDVASTPNKPTDHQAQFECGSGKGETTADEDKPVHDDLGSPLGKAVSELGVIIETFKSASPDNMGSPLKKAISRLGGNIETLKSASKNGNNDLLDAISHLGDNIEQLRELSSSIFSHADKRKERRVEDSDSCVTNLALQSSGVNLPSHSNESSSGPLENVLQRPSHEKQASGEVPTQTSVGDSAGDDSITHDNKNEGDKQVAPKGSMLVPHQPTVQEPELTKVWSDVDDDDDLVALPSHDVDYPSGDTSSTSSSSSSSSNSSSTSSSESRSDRDAAEHDSDLTESGDEAEDSENARISGDQDKTTKDDVKTNSIAMSNGPFDPTKQLITTSNVSLEHSRPDSSQGTHLPHAKTDVDTTAVINVTTDFMSKGDHATPKSDKDDSVHSTSSSDSDTSDSSSQSDSVSSSSSSDSESSSSANDDAMGLEIPTKTSKPSATTKELTIAVTKEDYRTPVHDGARSTTASGNKRRRRPLLSSNKKIII